MVVTFEGSYLSFADSAGMSALMRLRASAKAAATRVRAVPPMTSWQSNVAFKVMAWKKSSSNSGVMVRSSSSVRCWSSRFVSRPRRTALPMCSAEGDALVGEVRGGRHGVEVAGFGCGLHAVEAELQRAGEAGENAQDACDGVGGIEDRLLTFLEVFVVGERQALDERGECGGCAQETA